MSRDWAVILLAATGLMLGVTRIAEWGMSAPKPARVAASPIATPVEDDAARRCFAAGGRVWYDAEGQFAGCNVQPRWVGAEGWASPPPRQAP